MPNLKTSIKDLRKTKRRTVNNDRLRNRVKKSVKKFNDLIKQGEKDAAEKTLRHTFKVLDKAAKKNVINKGKASRKKSRLAVQLNKLSIDNVKTNQKGA